MKIETRFFKRCPKTGRIVGIQGGGFLTRFLFPLTGLCALIWFCLRTAPKPSRISYPCQQVAAPVAASFVAWLIALLGSLTFLRTASELVKQKKVVLAASALIAGIGTLVITAPMSQQGALAQTGANTGTFVRIDSVNTPIGIARGIIPGRVSWIHDPQAVSYNNQGNWPADQYNNQARIDNMVRRVLLSTSGKASIGQAWDTLFKFNNSARGRGNRGYQAGEHIAIKVNVNNFGSTTAIDASPQVLKAVLRLLVDSLGVAQENILIYDAMRLGSMGVVQNGNSAEFPNVRYNNISHPNGDWADSLRYSDPTISAQARQMPRWVAQADYMINLALLKRHCIPGNNWDEGRGQTAVTLTGKNHCGTTQCCSCLHNYIRDWYTGNAHYNALVDLMSSPLLNGKTVLFMVDGLYSGTYWGSNPTKWNMAPFNGYYPASIFASQDQVAIESVGLDFLRSEMPLTGNADNFIHEAALIGAPPSGTNYVNKGTATSMGVHEHWNNAVDKQYTRNLGTGLGIELYQVPVTGELPVSSLQSNRAVPADVSIQLSGVSGLALTSPTPLVSADFHDIHGILLQHNDLQGNAATLHRPSVAGTCLLKVKTLSGTRTFSLPN